MFRAHVLIVRKAKLYATVSGIITPIGGHPVHGQQNIKTCKLDLRPGNFFATGGNISFTRRTQPTVGPVQYHI
jgi:hypothetical protein